MVPFYLFSFLLSALIFGIHRESATCRKLFAVAGSGLAAYVILAITKNALLRTQFSQAWGDNPYAVVKDLDNIFTYVVAMVPATRIASLRVLLISSIPMVAGIVRFIWKDLRNIRYVKDDMNQVCRWILWGFSSSWVLWYVAFSIGWARYLFPGYFVGSLFTALLLKELTDGFNLRCAIRRAALTTTNWSRGSKEIANLIATVLLSAMVFSTLAQFAQVYVQPNDDSVKQTVLWLNTQTPPTAIVETYESEVLFGLRRRYHFPPDIVQHQLNRRIFLLRDEVITYDALMANPDYLVVGPFATVWQLYDPILATDAFSPIHTAGRYTIYQRKR